VSYFIDDHPLVEFADFATKGTGLTAAQPCQLYFEAACNEGIWCLNRQFLVYGSEIALQQLHGAL
jgi:hypothetical protein